MDIFKLFFNHDQRLDKLAKRNANKTDAEKRKEPSLEEFMQPDPTYSKFYITGTKLEAEQFGLNVLDKSNEVINQLDKAFANQIFYTASDSFNSLNTSISSIDIGQAVIIAEELGEHNISDIALDNESNVGHKKTELATILKTGALVLYKEQAHHGFDLHLFSRDNIYPLLFESFKPLVNEQFRFFSINSKRMGSERHFYFETWRLSNPPHGAEEVMDDTVL
jgi:hypothetical protein